MNCALIFAGGVGKRMNNSTLPKQFLRINDKPIIVYTIEKFQNNCNIDAIVVVIVAEYYDYMLKLIQDYNLSKVSSVVTGGSTGQESIYFGLCEIEKKYGLNDNIVLIHDGVRPLIDDATISNNIKCVIEKGNSITVTPSIETVVLLQENHIVDKVMDRKVCNLARAPQSFYLKDIFSCHKKAIEEGKFDFIDSAMMMQYYGYMINTVEGPVENIKVTTTMDYYLLKALLNIKPKDD